MFIVPGDVLSTACDARINTQVSPVPETRGLMTVAPRGAAPRQEHGHHLIRGAIGGEAGAPAEIH